MCFQQLPVQKCSFFRTGANLNPADFYDFFKLLLQKWGLNTNFSNPLMTKKQRISHLNSRIQPSCSSHLLASRQSTTAAPPLPQPPRRPAAATPAPLPMPPTFLPTSNPPQTASSHSSSTPEGQRTQDPSVDSFGQKSSSICGHQQRKYTFQTPSVMPAPAAVQVGPPKPTDKKHQSSEKVKEHNKEDKSKMQDATSASKEKDCQKEGTAKTKTLFHLDSGQGINMLLFLTAIWVTLVKRCQQKQGLEMQIDHLLYIKCFAIIPALWS